MLKEEALDAFSQRLLALAQYFTRLDDHNSYLRVRVALSLDRVESSRLHELVLQQLVHPETLLLTEGVRLEQLVVALHVALVEGALELFGEGEGDGEAGHYGGAGD